MNIPFVMRKCTKCGEWKVASTVNFHRAKKGKYELRSQCKECNKQYCQDNKEKIAEYSKRYYKANKEKLDERHKQYCEDNRDKIADYNKQWQKANRDKIAEHHKRYYQDNKEKRLEYQKQYYQSPQGQVAMFNACQRRRIKEEQQGSGITKDQWLEMMQYFDWKCAYSGEYLGGNDNSFNRTIDHIVPLDSGGDNAIWNCVPMLRSLNCSKHTNNMEEWYKEQDCYDPKRLAKIYEWQEFAYNKWGKNTQYFNTNDIQIKLL